MTTVHIVTNYFPPQIGGLQRWVYNLTTALLGAGIQCVVYICEYKNVSQYHRGAPFEVVDVASILAPWEEPLDLEKLEANLFSWEHSRLSFACLKSEIVKRLGSGPNLMVSCYITNAGFMAHLVAESLELPHIPVIVGTDFSRGFRNAAQRQIILEVCQFARVVVCKSREQIRAISRRLPGTRCMHLETSIEMPTRRWRKPTGKEVGIFSDTGFSFKKGTGVLMDAFVALRRKGMPARLEICGSDAIGQEGYWIERRRALESQGCDAVSFPGYLNRDEIVDRICASDIYASATLGEGSSSARELALCLGVPMVTTSCGELVDGAPASHVRLVSVGDAPAFHHAVLDLTTAIVTGKLTIDDTAVENFRRRFAPHEPWADWLSLIHEVSIQ